MKIFILSVVLGIMAQFSYCQEIPKKTYKLSTEVVTENLDPVQGAVVQSSRDELIPGSVVPHSKPVRVDAFTDENGIAVMTLISVQTPSGVAIKKDGFYPSSAMADWEYPAGFNGPWSAKIKAIIKPIRNPIPMYARSNMGQMSGYVRIPELNKDYGYDLMIGQALPPFGKGMFADFYFRVEGIYADRKSNDLKLTIRFLNQNDGVVEFSTPQRMGMREPQMYGSHLISEYLAPEAGYFAETTRICKTTDEGKVRNTNVDQTKNFYFRTRTKTLPDGRIISANYGKIYGDFDFSSGNIDKGFFANFGIVVSYFNPTPNDRNVEFDTKRNLLTDGNVQRP